MNSEYEVVHVYHYASHYMYCKEDGYVYFKSLRDNLDIGYLDLRNMTFYENTKFKNMFINAKCEIKKDYDIKQFSEYLDMV